MYWDNVGISNKEVMRVGSKGVMKTYTHLGGASSIGPEAVGSKTKDDVGIGVPDKIGGEVIELGTKYAPVEYKEASCSQALAHQKHLFPCA